MTSREEQDGRRSSGITRDIRAVRDNGTASLQELREFVGTLKGRRPQEVMGIVAGNGLVQGIGISAIGFVVVLLVFTAIPFFLASDESVAKTVKPRPATNSSTRQQPTNDNQGDASKPGSETSSSGDELLDRLRIGETKTANPDENPLDKKLDNLLDGVK